MEGRRALIGAIVVATAGAVAACDTRTLPPFGQLRIHVETDAPIPAIVSRLRVDVFSDGLWIESRDVSLRDRAEWPASFTVLSSETSAARRIRVRLRAYREGALRDYRGERYVPPPPPDTPPSAEPSEPAPSGEPRLVMNGVDQTPLDEPTPEAAIDRLVGTTLREGDVHDVRVVLRIECAGTMADLAGDRTCLSRRGALVTTPDAIADADTAPSPWIARLEEARRALPPPRPGRTAPDGTPLHDDEVVVPGGVLLLGSREHGTIGTVHGKPIPATPERVFVIPPMLLDRFEYTVARYRDALRRGFTTAPPPFVNEEPGFDAVKTNGLCTFSTSPMPGADSREEMPLICVEWKTARALCLFDGGDLPTEAAWEHAATTADRPAKTAFPWGDDSPTCADAIWGRFNEPLIGAPCVARADPGGVLPVTAAPRDVTPSGVRGLGGMVSELTRDAYRPYRSGCWAGAPLWDPDCADDAHHEIVLRGGAWTMAPLSGGAIRVPSPRGGYASDGGFRCARR